MKKERVERGSEREGGEGEEEGKKLVRSTLPGALLSPRSEVTCVTLLVWKGKWKH